MHKTKITITVTIVYLLTVVFWLIFILATGYEATYEGKVYNFLLKPFLIGMTALPILGGLFGLYRASEWGGIRSAVGKSIALFSLGSIFWGLGMVLWNYYLFVGIEEVPYPSWADAAFILSWPIWALGVVFLSKATGIRFALRAMKGKVQLALIPLFAIVASYYLLVVVARGGMIGFDSSNALKLFFDLFYPIGTAIILAMALTFFSLSKDFLGGCYKAPIIVLIVAFIVNYLADFMFSYTTTYETYFNGHFVDFLFATAMYLLVLSLSLMSPNILEEHENKIS